MDEKGRHLAPGQAISIKIDSSAKIIVSNPSQDPVHFVMFDGAQVGEPFVQDGPFVMGSQQQIADIKAAYKAGQFGTIANNR